MVIDIHAHPILFDVINQDREDFERRRKQLGVYKSGITPLDFELTLLKDAQIDKVVLLGEDYSSEGQPPMVSNDEMKKIVDSSPEHFIGFAGVDPRRSDAKEELVRAFDELKLSGLKLNVSRLHMYPNDPSLLPLYEICEERNKPIMFHAGYSWEPNTPSKYARPINFEDVAVDFPNLRFCLAHMGWPWWEETIMMLMKYDNVYADTSTVYMDSPKNYYSHLFSVNMDLNWLQNCFAEKVMYGSNTPRFRHIRSLAGIKNLPLRPEVLEAIIGGNAERFLGLEG
ncbi:MAG: amidohydrolase family protein [Eubacteriales bacterium]|nr:amidohydrolase family protein [Eubacteriales bacterium]